MTILTARGYLQNKLHFNQPFGVPCSRRFAFVVKVLPYNVIVKIGRRQHLARNRMINKFTVREEGDVAE